MEQKTLIFFIIFHVLALLILDISFMACYIASISLEEKDKPTKHIVCQIDLDSFFMQILIDIICFLGWAMAYGLTNVMVEIDKYERSFKWQYLKSPLGLFILGLNTLIMAVIFFGYNYLSGTFLALKLTDVRDKEMNVKKCQDKLRIEINEIKSKISTCEDEQTKEVFKESLKKYQSDLRVYDIMERSLRDQILDLQLKLSAHNIEM